MFSPYASYRINKPVGLGAVVEVNKAKAILQVLGNRYPVMSGSCTLAAGCSPAMDDKADFWSFQAVMTKEEAGGTDMTVYQQLMSLAPGAKALVDIASANKALEAGAGTITYVIAKNDAVCKALSQGAGASLQELPVGSSTPSSEEKKGIKGSAIVGGLLAAGAGALVAGPAGAVIGGLAVGYLLQTTDSKAV